MSSRSRPRIGPLRPSARILGGIWSGSELLCLLQRTKDGSVVTWGMPTHGGDSHAVRDELRRRQAKQSLRL